MSKGRGDYPGSNDSNLGPVGRAAQAVCLATMPNSHQEMGCYILCRSRHCCVDRDKGKK